MWLTVETNDPIQIMCDDFDVNNEVSSDMFKLFPGIIPNMEVEDWPSPSIDEQILTDEEIIVAINNIEDKPIEKDTGISHVEAMKILDEALRCIEAQDDATIANVFFFFLLLLFKRWLGNAEFKRTKFKQQKKMTSYFVNPNVL